MNTSDKLKQYIIDNYYKITPEVRKEIKKIIKQFKKKRRLIY